MNSKAISHTVVSLVLNVCRHIFLVFDILPVLASVYISFVFSATLITLLSPELSVMLSSLGFGGGVLWETNSSGESMGRDFRKANLIAIGTAFLMIPAVLLVFFRNVTSSPPRSYLQLYWTITVGLLAIYFWWEAVQTGQSLVQNTKYDSIIDIIYNMSGYGSIASSDNKYAASFGFFLMSFYLSAFTYLILALVSLCFIAFKKLPLHLGNRNPLTSLQHIFPQILREVRIRKTLFWALRLLLAVIVINCILLFEQLASLINFNDIVFKLIHWSGISWSENSDAYFGSLPTALSIILGSSLLYPLSNCLIFDIETVKAQAFRFSIVVVLLCVSLYLANSEYGRSALAILILGLFIAAFFPSIIFLRGVFADFKNWCKLVSIRVTKASRFDEKPILLLRPFLLDTIRLKGRLPWIHRLLPFFSNDEYFEETISRSAYRYGPLLGVGKPGENSPPLGAIREYFSGKEWEPFIEKTVQDAHRIVFICGATKHTSWETEIIVKYKLVDKLVLVIPPIKNEATQYFNENPDLVSMLDIPDKWLGDIEKGKIRCIYRKNFEAVAVYNRFSALEDYQLALDEAFKAH